MQHFLKLIVLHIKLNENTKCNKMVSNILPPDPPDPRSLKVKIQLVLNMVKLNGIKNCSNMVANILPPYPPPLTLGSNRSKFDFSEQCHDEYQIKGNYEI